MASKTRRNKPSLLEPIEEVSVVIVDQVDQDSLQDCAEPSALPAEQPSRPQRLARQNRQTRLKSKDNKAPPGSGAHKNGGEADQETPVENVLSPVLDAGTGMQHTNSPGTHEVSCLCGMSETAKEGLLVQCDSCKKWVHCKCYKLDEQTVCRDDYSFSCMTCLPRPVLTHVVNNSGDSSVPPPDNSGAVLETLIERVSVLEVELDSTKQCLEDQKMQHKTQCKVLQSQMLSLEEQNSLLEKKIYELSQKCSISHNRTSRQSNHGANLAPTDPPIQEAQEHTTSVSPPLLSHNAQHSRNTPVRNSQPCNSHLFRIIWGTRKSCSEADIRATLAQLTSLNTQDYTVKKSFRCLGSRKAWWFTVIASSPIALTSLDEAWEASKPDANWTLLQSLRDHPFLRHSQGHPHQNPCHSELNAPPPASLPSLQSYRPPHSTSSASLPPRQSYPPPQLTNSDPLPSLQPYPPLYPTNSESSLIPRPSHPIPTLHRRPAPSPLQHPAQFPPPLNFHQAAAVTPY